MKTVLPSVILVILYFQCSVILAEDVLSGSLRGKVLDRIVRKTTIIHHHNIIRNIR